MKKLYIYILLLLVPFSSCHDIFQEEDDMYVDLLSEQEKIDLLNGIYNRLTKVHDKNYFLLCLRSDDVKFHYAEYNPDGDNGFDAGWIPNEFLDNTIGNMYHNLYYAILNANRLIIKVNSDENSAIVGEAYFLRGYCYLKLARFFGTPYLVKDIDVKYNLKPPGFKEVYDFIEADLLKAIDLLPNTYAYTRIPNETPHVGTAKALLAEVYLSMAGYPVNDVSKYADAARLSGEVIDNAEYYNFELVSDISNLWNNEYRHNNENIFGLFYNDELGTINTIAGSNMESYYKITPNGNEHYYKSYFNWYYTDEEFYKNFPDNYRKYNSMITGIYKKVEHKTPFETFYSYEFEKIGDKLTQSNAIPLKWITLSPYLPGDKVVYRETSLATYSNTLYLLRYAHTLLTYAEAKCRLGELDESAYEAINKIKRRASNLDIHATSIVDLPYNLTNDEFLQAILWERAWELFFEPDGRWFDIIRNDMGDFVKDLGIATKSQEINSEFLTADWYFYKMPE